MPSQGLLGQTLRLRGQTQPHWASEAVSVPLWASKTHTKEEIRSPCQGLEEISAWDSSKAKLSWQAPDLSLNSLPAPSRAHCLSSNRAAPPFPSLAHNSGMILGLQTQLPQVKTSSPSPFLPQDLTWSGDGTKTDVILPRAQPPPCSNWAAVPPSAPALTAPVRSIPTAKEGINGSN